MFQKISFILQTLYNSIYMHFTTIEMLSKNKGLILRVAAGLHVAFCMETPGSIPEELSVPSIRAAQDFVNMCCQHTIYIGSRGNLRYKSEFSNWYVIGLDT